MKVWDICCYVLLMITVSTSYVEADEYKKDLSQSNHGKRITKRDATIFIEGFPIEPIYKQRPHVIYRRISSPRYTHSKPKYGPPRSKYRSSKPRAPPKKHKKTNHSKYGPPKYKQRQPKPRYGPPKSMKHKPVYGPPKPSKKKPIYGPPKKEPQSVYYPPEPVGFGEPPPDYIQDYQLPKLTYAEPPTDSYGTPLKITSDEIYPPLKTYPEAQPSPTSYDNQDYSFGQEYKSWQNYQNNENTDSKYSYSKKRPTFIKPEPEEVFDAVSAPDEDVHSYSDVYKETQSDHDFEPYERRRKPYYSDGPKKFKKQWNVARATPEPDDEDDVIVGGQYAEPPARYIPKFQPSAPMYYGDENFNPKGFTDADIVTSATMSPYVNYKNSNIAFSPQNLNDAFSIVDK